MREAGVVQMLNAQLNREFYLSNLYFKLSDWCLRHRLNGSALFLRHQAQGNVTQMMHVFDFMKRAGAVPVVGMNVAPYGECASLEELYEKVLDNCNKREASLGKLASKAESADDREMLAFLRELEQMQQEGGLLVNALLEEVRKAQNAGMGMEQTDRRLEPLLPNGTH